MAKVNWNSMSEQFGESFLYALENERKRKQETDLFNLDLAFKNRQSDLDETYRKEVVGIDRSQEGRLTEEAKAEFQNDYIPLSPKFDITKGGFEAFQQAPPGSIQSSKDIQEDFPILGKGLQEGLYANKNLIPGAPKLPEDRYETKTSGAIGTGQYKGQKVDIIRDKYNNTEFEQPIHQEPKKEEERPTLLKEKFERDAFGRLINPQSAKQAPDMKEDPIGYANWIWSGAGKTYSVDNDFTTVATGLLQDSDMLKKLQTIIQTEGGYPSGQRLVDMLEPQLSDEQLKKLNTFLDYYDQFEMNLPKNTKPMKTY